MNTDEHLVTCAGEEAVEIATELLKIVLALSKVTAKSLRFGNEDRNVIDPTGPTNAERLVAELNDMLAVADMLAERGIIPRNWQDATAQARKKGRVLHFLNYAEGTGALREDSSTTTKPH